MESITNQDKVNNSLESQLKYDILLNTRQRALHSVKGLTVFFSVSFFLSFSIFFIFIDAIPCNSNLNETESHLRVRKYN